MAPPTTPARAGGVTHDQLRRRNLSLLLRHVHTRGPASRAQLTEMTGLNRSTTATLVADLTAAGLVREEASRTHQGAGRPSPVVHPVAASAQVIALDVGVERIGAERVGLGGRVLEHRTIPTDGPPAFEETTARLADLVEALARAAEAEGRCVGVGVAVPGLVRREDGMVRFAPNLAWADRPLAAALAAALAGRPGPRAAALPIAVANDADLGALAAHTRGAARGHDDFLYVSGNVGVGGGLFCGGRPMVGRRGYAGEIGHMIVNPQGRRCRCGARGCWETEIGTGAVVRAAGLPPDQDVSAVVRAARGGDRQAARALDDAARWLAVGLANLANILDPGLVVFGGDLCEIYETVIDRVGRYAAETGLSGVRALPEHRASVFGLRAPLVGAGELAFTPLLEDPLLHDATRPHPPTSPAGPGADPQR